MLTHIDLLVDVFFLYPQLVTVFIPTTLINIISFATFSFKWFDFQNRIMVSLTALLVLSTLFSQISDSLPKTSYFKLVDVWFFSSILFTFLTIMTHTLVEYKHHYTSNVDPNPKTSMSSFLPITVAPAVISHGGVERPLKGRNVTSAPELINKTGFIFILTAYIVFYIIFWGVAFSQKIMENSKKFTREHNMMTVYPD